MRSTNPPAGLCTIVQNCASNASSPRPPSNPLPRRTPGAMPSLAPDDVPSPNRSPGEGRLAFPKFDGRSSHQFGPASNSSGLR